MIDALGAGPLYRLDNPGPEDEHESGFVVGLTGFHELVLVDRARSLVRVVVASDD